ncbi:hypothetical protein SS05631_c18260 [Sinorhizobium sp. CCBAU 05631]|nr:hypothetical protein SS05631_c18260 [Sinorhizobium sp. CCBAU 05631]
MAGLFTLTVESIRPVCHAAQRPVCGFRKKKAPPCGGAVMIFGINFS